MQVLRVHTAGDFYDAEYARKWLEVVRHCPRTRFYAYARSWRVSEIAPVLVEMAARKNVRLWYSADRDTGVPPDVPPRVRVAWLQDHTDATTDTVDLVFRVRRLRRQPTHRVGLTLVCPVESGTPKAAAATCTTCRHCWK